MDYQGQALCEKLYQLILVTAGLVGFAWGYVEQSFWLTFLCCGGGLALATLVCVPDWPIYRRHPMAWQPAHLLPGETDASGELVKDTNASCGTCMCGAQVHGIDCESHPDYAARQAEQERAAADTQSETPAKEGKGRGKHKQ